MGIPKKPEPEITVLIRRLFSPDESNTSGSYPAEVLIMPPGEKSLNDHATITSRYYTGTFELLPTPKKAGRPKADRLHAAVFAEFTYLQLLGNKKIAAREKLSEKYGYADERSVRRVTNAPEWDESRWSCCVGTNTHQHTFVVLFDKSKAGYIRGFGNKLLAAKGMGWTWSEGRKRACWGDIQLKSSDPVPPDLFTNDKYILETFPQKQK